MLENQNVKELTTQEKIKSVIDDYNDIAIEYSEEFDNDTSDNKYIDKFLQCLNGKKILDVGCGTGRDCKYIEQKGYDVIGIDISKEMLKIAKEKYPKGKFEIMDMTNIDYPDNTFDGIMSNCSVFHIPEELLSQTMESFKRVLKNNGKLFLILQEGHEQKMVEEPYRHGVYVYMNYFSKKNIEQLLEEHNFKIDKIDIEKSSNQFELGSRKIIVYSSINKSI